MKTAISLPDPVFRRSERVAKQLKVSRSELYRRALETFLALHDDTNVTASYDAGFAEPDSAVEAPFRADAARKALLAVEWQE